ncbi:MAG: hypothetical protein NT085_02765 [candidate division SR1 bacterium]|nr:hypothetical protein [candidate division SR1 bacterium]
MAENYDFSLTNTLEDNQHLVFYKIMKYDVPRHYSYFLFEKKGWKKQEDILRGQEFPPDEPKYSWDKKNPYIDDFLKYINKYSRLYRSVPFIQSIYLCNSITFNALNADSDIDVFIVTKKGSLRRARFWSAILFFLFGLKRGAIRGKKKKFCLSFYVTQTHQNLYNIMLPQNDIYFMYWLAHLVPLYQETPENIYKHNKWLESALPNFPGRHCIDIGLKPTGGKTKFKKIVEFLSGGIIGQACEYLIKLIRLPIVIYKTKQLKERGWGIVVNNNMLKFHMDIRKKIHLLYIMYKKKMNK